MNRITLLLLICIASLLSSCRKDCPDKQYFTNIALANNTGYELDVKLFPKKEFQISDGFYRAGDIGGGSIHKEITIDDVDISMYSFKYVLFTSYDTTWTPNDLLAHVFDSIYLKVSDSTNTEIIILHDTAINFIVNPFQDQSVWNYKLIDSSMPDNYCENKAETHSYRFFIEKEHFLPY